METCEPLDTSGASKAGVPALALVVPGVGGAVVVLAVGVGAVGRMPAGGFDMHVPGPAG